MKIMKKPVLMTVCVSMMIPMLAACTKANQSDDKTERVLRIATSMGYSANDEWFRQRFTELFEFANPNIKLEILTTQDERFMYGRPDPNTKPEDPMEKMKKLMEGDNPPDVVMVGYEQLPELISSNMLTQLDPMITKDKFDTSDIVPAVLEGLKKVGDGKLYALAPNFGSSALIYNKKMFDEAGVPYPKDKMTWEETMELARRLVKGEGESRKYGFSFSTHNMGENMFYAAQMMSAPLELRMYDEKGEKMTVDNPSWEKVWNAALQWKNEKLIPGPIDYNAMRNRSMDQENFNPFQGDDFLSGRVAMSIIHYGQLDQIVNANKSAQNIKGFTPIDWDVVTVPVHQEAPDVGGQMYMDGIMSINAKAQNVQDAWKFIKFINGEEYAKLKSSSSNYIVSRKKYIKPKNGVEFNIAAFTTLTPVMNQQFDNKLYREKPGIVQVNEIAYRTFEEVSQGKMSVKDGLKKWQTEGDALLQSLKDNPNGPARDQGMMMR
ncbi:extracellular solute-binding protein [Paenibacillus sp. GD4]|uniref:ABC transporter substrate-binding protein n=1 Tax=Paenibacillus sp. GD4 TaxID=3068890 RepID=UPI002796CBDE|nr:extracellular solute-binding protein [Paenibacillus sp. GD4]MDQ1913045.1 extracellular solute-binding protein [Paenibacillus sp. GD4]